VINTEEMRLYKNKMGTKKKKERKICLKIIPVNIC